MSGHSKWSNIRRKKEASDAAKGAVFTKIAKEIAVAVKAGGPDPDGNSRLKVVVAKAKAANMPNDNINRAIKKAAEAGEGDDYEEITYEGYGPAGVAIMVKTLTNNRNRTAADVRHIFDKNGGNLGVSGSVGFLFEEKGSIIVSREDYPDEDAVMTDALEAGDFAYISLVPTIVGIVVAAAAGYFALRFMLRIIAKVPLSVFAVYLAILGIVFLLLQLSGSSLVPAFVPSPAPVG